MLGGGGIVLLMIPKTQNLHVTTHLSPKGVCRPKSKLYRIRKCIRGGVVNNNPLEGNFSPNSSKGAN